MDITETTREYVKHRFLTELKPEEGRYRYTHTLRVADLGRLIASSEGLDEEMLVLGCLLHDIGYVACKEKTDFADHGLKSAQIAAEFLAEQGYDSEKAASICYGIRIHTQEDELRSRPATALEDSISDADNIDRFDALRFANSLRWENLDKLTVPQTLDMASTRLQRIRNLRTIRFATNTAKKWWNRKLDLWEDFYLRLERQMIVTMDLDKKL